MHSATIMNRPFFPQNPTLWIGYIIWFAEYPNQYFPVRKRYVAAIITIETNIGLLFACGFKELCYSKFLLFSSSRKTCTVNKTLVMDQSLNYGMKKVFESCTLFSFAEAIDTSGQAMCYKNQIAAYKSAAQSRSKVIAQGTYFSKF